VVPPATIEDVLTQQGKHNAYRCKLPAMLLVYFIIGLGLQRAQPYREVLRWLLDGLKPLWGAARLPAKMAGKAAISMARTALGWPVLQAVFAACAQPLATAATRGAWFAGRRLVALDGTAFATPDTASNTAAFGKSGSKHGASAFPLARVLVLVELGTHAVFGAAIGSWRSGETTLARRLLPRLGPGMLLLADRIFFSRALWDAACATGADLLWRVKADLDLPVEQALPDGSYLSTVYRTRGACRRGVGGRRVRVITYALPGVPHADACYRLVTTLLDPDAATAQDVAALYHERWEVEGVLDEVKTHLRGGNALLLRSLTGDGVRQEIYGLLLAHYTVRTVMHDAALQSGEDPDRLSFVHTVRVLRRQLSQGAALPPSAVATLV